MTFTERFELESKKEAKQLLSLRISMIAIIAALYTALGYSFAPISFLGIQFRVAEILVGFCILFPYAGVAGNMLGVLFVNLTSPLGVLDLISVPVNLPALLCITLLRNKKILKYVGATLYAAIISLYVALLLNYVIGLPIWLMFVQVFIAEEVLACFGVFIFNRIRLSFAKRL